MAESNVIVDLHQRLGIPADYAARTGLVQQRSPDDLVDIGVDVFDRPQRLRMEAANGWMGLVEAASLDGVTVQLVSAYRSLEYQVDLIQRKVEAGESIGEILTHIAAPGYSEHQGGCAVDVTSPGIDSLTEFFEETQAFRWLVASAADYRFVLSYPRSNPYGVVYEPWHWCYRPIE
ncbi:MAG: M15 family metallopeptidase [Pseudomonadales bacterium]